MDGSEKKQTDDDFIATGKKIVIRINPETAGFRGGFYVGGRYELQRIFEELSRSGADPHHDQCRIIYDRFGNKCGTLSIRDLPGIPEVTGG